MTLLGDMIVAGDFQITADDRVIKTQGSARFEAMATPLFQYKNFVFMWGGSYGKEHRCAYLLTPYLASINNLSSAVVKNTDKTMKITYTLTEETMYVFLLQGMKIENLFTAVLRNGSCFFHGRRILA